MTTNYVSKADKIFIENIQDILNNGKDYKSFTGINEDMNGDVKFIFRTSEIKSEK